MKVILADKLKKLQSWLVNDQFDHGEWGKCEATKPSLTERNFADSQKKPNMFTSSHAYYSLIATGYNNKDIFDRYYKWLGAIRNSDGFWTSASGSKIPFGPDRDCGEVVNLRHCAKGLDILLLNGQFNAQDFYIFQTIIESQLEEGAFSSSLGGSIDIWSTAYIINLLIRALFPENINKTRPRNSREDVWASALRNRLHAARTWMCKQTEMAGIWEIEETDPFWVSEAVLIEVGGDLILNRPDICQVVAKHLINEGGLKRPVALWGLLLLFPCLSSAHQKQVLQSLECFARDYVAEPKQTLEGSCLCRLYYIANNPAVLRYYINTSDGHESSLVSPSPWANSEYEKWCVSKTMRSIEENKISSTTEPNDASEAWLTIIEILEKFKHSVEKEKLWEILWDINGNPVKEKKVQTVLWESIKGRLKGGTVIYREIETGRGLADFEFNNGFGVRIIVEIKLASNPNLKHGLQSQLIEYMEGTNVSSGVYLVFGFIEGDYLKYNGLMDIVDSLHKNHPDKFVDVMYIDAKRQKSASRH